MVQSKALVVKNLKKENMRHGATLNLQKSEKILFRVPLIFSLVCLLNAYQSSVLFNAKSILLEGHKSSINLSISRRIIGFIRFLSVFVQKGTS